MSTRLEARIEKLEQKIEILKDQVAEEKRSSQYEVKWNKELNLENGKLHRLLDTAWGVIANCWNGDWSKSSNDWRKAAEKWRNRYFDVKQ